MKTRSSVTPSPGAAETIALPHTALVRAKQYGFADARLAALLTQGNGHGRLQQAAQHIRTLRQQQHITATFQRVDTCGAEFVAHTPYLYSTYERACEAAPQAVKKMHDPRRWPQSHRAGHRV